MEMSNFLDIWDILVNELIGSVWLFIFLGIIVIIYLSVQSKFTTEVSIMFILIFLAAVFAESKMIILWVFVVLFVGTLFYYKYQKIIRSG